MASEDHEEDGSGLCVVEPFRIESVPIVRMCSVPLYSILQPPVFGCQLPAFLTLYFGY
jgi:hypothetical protein